MIRVERQRAFYRFLHLLAIVGELRQLGADRRQGRVIRIALLRFLYDLERCARVFRKPAV